MAQTLLEASEHHFLVTALGIDHPVGMEAGTGERRGEEIAVLEAPEDGAG